MILFVWLTLSVPNWVLWKKSQLISNCTIPKKLESKKVQSLFITQYLTATIHISYFWFGLDGRFKRPTKNLDSWAARVLDLVNKKQLSLEEKMRVPKETIRVFSCIYFWRFLRRWWFCYSEWWSMMFNATFCPSSCRATAACLWMTNIPPAYKLQSF